MNPILQILNRPWYIDFQSAVDYSWAVQSLLEGKIVFEVDKETFQPRMVAQAAASSGSSKSSRQSQVAVIPIQGPLMKKDQYCGPVGMDTIGTYIKNADRNPDIDAIILDIDSPGGTVAGTAMLGDVIANTQKPIVAFVNELAASAAYWLASQCDLIIASDEKAQVGSIGVMMSFADVQPAYERLGVKFHDIVAPQSTDKNKLFKELQKGDYENYRDNVLRPLADRFIETAKKGRGGKITDESIFKGRVEFADKALEIGLIDSIGTFEFAVQSALDLSNKKNKTSAQAKSNQINKTVMAKHPKLAAVLGVELEMNDGGSFLNESQLSAIENKLAEHQSAIDAVVAERDQAKNDLQAANDAHAQELESKTTEIANLTTQVQEKQTEIASIRKNGGERSASESIKVKTDVEASGGIDPLVQEINSNLDDSAQCIAILKKNGY